MKNRETFGTSLHERGFFRREERASAKVLRDYVTRIGLGQGRSRFRVNHSSASRSLGDQPSLFCDSTAVTYVRVTHRGPELQTADARQTAVVCLLCCQHTLHPALHTEEHALNALTGHCKITPDVWLVCTGEARVDQLACWAETERVEVVDLRPRQCRHGRY